MIIYITKTRVEISLVDYIGVVDGGVAVSLSFVTRDKMYPAVYWFTPSGDYRLVMGETFYTDHPYIKSVYDVNGFEKVVMYIDKVILPPREDVFGEFNLC